MAETAPRGVIIAGTTSGAGKTIATCALIGALKNAGHTVAAAKCGPDYIDPAFLTAAAGAPAINLDPWAMSGPRMAQLLADHSHAADLVVIEGVMGLFDGAENGAGSTAALAAATGLPVILVVSAAGTAQSAAATAAGFDHLAHDNNLKIAGIIVTQVASPRHADLVREGFQQVTVPLLGLLPRQAGLALKSRHLGLVQAREHQAIRQLMDEAARLATGNLDLEKIIQRIAPISLPVEAPAPTRRLTPPGQRIAIASDDAFAFVYTHWLTDFRQAGAEITLFSPLADEAPAKDADAIILPGGYPELHGSKLAEAAKFKRSLGDAAARSAPIYGECGGYMMLGEGLIDAQGQRHEMAGLLPLVSDFSNKKLHLGYRQLIADKRFFWDGRLRAHEFHYATIRHQGDAGKLFDASDATGNDLGAIGLRQGSVAGSFVHIIDRAPDN